jgi:hypothetical protein
MGADFGSLTGTVNTGAGTVTLTWDSPHQGNVNESTIVKVEVLRSLFGYENFAVIATSTGVDFTGKTYTDTVPSVGQYSYKVRYTVGVAPHTVTLESNVTSASTDTAVVLSGSVSGKQVTLTWDQSAGNYDDVIVQRSADGGVTYQTVRKVDGASTSFVEELSASGTYKYRLQVSVEEPETLDNASEFKDGTITSNVVTLTVS